MKKKWWAFKYSLSYIPFHDQPSNERIVCHLHNFHIQYSVFHLLTVPWQFRKREVVIKYFRSQFWLIYIYYFYIMYTDYCKETYINQSFKDIRAVVIVYSVHLFVCLSQFSRLFPFWGCLNITTYTRKKLKTENK